MVNDGLVKTNFDSFEVDCYWYIDKNVSIPNDDDAHGSIKITPKKKIAKIIWPYGDKKVDEAFSGNIIYGMTIDGTFVEIKNLSLISGNVFSGLGFNEYDVGTCIFSNVSFAKISNFDEFYLATDSSSAWLPILQTRQVTGKQDIRYGLKDLNAFIGESNTIFISTFTFKNIHFLVRLEGRFYGPNNVYKTRKWNFVFITDFVFTSKNKITDNIAITIARSFSRFLSLIIGSPQEIKYLCPQKQNYFHNIFPRLITRKKLQNELKLKDYIFDFHSFSDSWFKILNNWFSMPINLKLLIDNYLLTIRPYTVKENNLINLCQGIDSYYEHGSLFEKIVNTIKSLPQSIQEDLTKQHKYFLNGILTKITEEDLQNARIASNDYISIWARSIKDTRVYLVHGNIQNTKFRITNQAELLQSINMLRFLENCFILQQLGYDKLDNTKVIDFLNSIINPIF